MLRWNTSCTIRMYACLHVCTFAYILVCIHPCMEHLTVPAGTERFKKSPSPWPTLSYAHQSGHFHIIDFVSPFWNWSYLIVSWKHSRLIDFGTYIFSTLHHPITPTAPYYIQFSFFDPLNYWYIHYENIIERILKHINISNSVWSVFSPGFLAWDCFLLVWVPEKITSQSASSNHKF